ncbi:hypothetical protein [Asticcacaulis taihuensis]|uniref:hypothetical protein n=1 Tax=Asticcacaulis taihuensis TaxID=260084 RepID=UPI003F7CD2F8
MSPSSTDLAHHGHARSPDPADRHVAGDIQPAGQSVRGAVRRGRADWTRSGHLSSLQAVIADPAYQSQPHRRDLMAITRYGQGLPIDVQRQFAIQDMLSEELAAAITGAKPIEQALQDAGTRINDMLTNLS